MAISAPSFQSSLNPNAPYFFPASFYAAEDFSPEWWHLVQTCPAFREYWLTERFEEEVLLAPDAPLFNDTDFYSDLDSKDADLEENLPSLSGLDIKDFAQKVGLNGSSRPTVKQNKPVFNPLPYLAKPLKVAHPQKPVLRKIQQPR